MLLQTYDSSYLNGKINDLQDRFLQIEAVLKNDLPKLYEDINLLRSFTTERHSDRNYRLKNANLSKICFNYMANGVSYNDAVIMAARDCNDTIERAELVCNKEKIRKKALERYAKIYMIQTLLENGVKNVEIAKITGFTPEYISSIKNGKKRIKFNNIDLS